MTKKRRKFRKNALIVLSILSAVIIGLVLYLILSFNIHFIGVKSIHEDASKYQVKHCLAFYPSGKNSGEKIAREVCSGVNDDRIFDYVLKPYGDYFLVDYGQGNKFFIDKDNQDLVISNQDINDNAKHIIADYLRYQMKKEGRDEAYSLEFLENSTADKVDISNATYQIEDEYLLCHLPSYDIDLKLPLKYLQKEIGKNFGYQNELYKKPRFIDPNKPMVALTFDDGPYIPTTSQIVDVLEKYDASATFFCLGNRLGADKEVPFIKEAIEKGNEYGSHTQSHYNLGSLTKEEVLSEITIPAQDLKNGFGYEMRLYRPPYGYRDSEIDAVSPYPAILWNVDSLDWKSRDPESIKEIVYGSVDNYDIVLFHDIYQSTVDAVVDIVPKLISDGYQLVTVSEMMESLGISFDEPRFSGR